MAEVQKMRRRPATIEKRKRWSARSQRSFLQQRELETQGEKCQWLIRFTKEKIAKLEQGKERQLKGSLGDDQWSAIALESTLRGLEDENRNLAAYEERLTLLRSETAKLVGSTRSQARKRAKAQDSLALLVRGRLEKDGLVERAIERLRALLQERAKLTAKIAQGAAAIDLTIDPGRGLDARRFDELLELLPVGMAVASARWARWFLGEEKGGRPDVVSADYLVVPETLASPGFYRRGDKITVSQEQVRSLPGGEHPAANAKLAEERATSTAPTDGNPEAALTEDYGDLLARMTAGTTSPGT